MRGPDQPPFDRPEIAHQAVRLAGHGSGDWHGSVGLYFGPSWGWGWPYAYPYYYGYPYGYPYYGYPGYGYRYYGYPYRYDPYYGYPDGDPYVPAPRTYIERVPEAATTYWYYCTDPAGYYPYVKSCPSGWKAVLPQDVPSPSNAPRTGGSK